MPKVSVIIPVYNVEKYLRQCLDSVVNQTLKDIEIICIDDGSTDNSLNILEEYAAKDNRIKIINQENKGAGAARNKGLDIAKGEYIMFLDADDFFEYNACEYGYNFMKEHAYNDIGIFGYNHIISGKIYESWRYNLIKEIIQENKEYKKYYYLIFVWDKIYKRNFIEKYQIKFWENLKSAEDSVFNYLCYFKNTKTEFIPKILINHRENEKGSISSSPDITQFDIDTFKKIYQCNAFRQQNIYIQLLVVEHFLHNFNGHLKKYKKSNNYKKICKLIADFYKYIDSKYKKNNLNTIEIYRNYKKKHNLLRKIFSLTNEKKHKILCLFGIRFKFKRSNNV